jgi:hypothetical protein
MLSIENVRELTKNPALSDEEATIIRDACHQWAELALDAYLNTRDEPRRLDRLLVLTQDPLQVLRNTPPEFQRSVFVGYAYLFIQATSAGNLSKREAACQIIALGELIHEQLVTIGDRMILGAARGVLWSPSPLEGSAYWSVLVGSVGCAAFASETLTPLSLSF